MVFLPLSLTYKKERIFALFSESFAKKSRTKSSGRECIREGLSLAAAYNSGGGGGGGGGWSMAHGGGREREGSDGGKRRKQKAKNAPRGRTATEDQEMRSFFLPSPFLSFCPFSIPPSGLPFLLFLFSSPFAPDQNEIVPDSAALQQWGKREELPVVLSYSYKLWQVFGHPPILPTRKKHSP